ncbi:MAG: tetratricopeptide repeat protein [Elusimicrobia bacterium]|nr:tetratricopeptide repeat protein [Elusimicrobiota bacterium]
MRLDKALALLEGQKWLDLLWDCPAVAGDIRFLREFFLPEHGRYRRQVYEKALFLLSAEGDSPPSARALAARGRVRRILGDATGALSDLDRAAALDPKLATAYAFRGELKASAGSAGFAEDFDKALELDPGAGPFHLWKGFALFSLGRNSPAAVCLDKAVELAPELACALIARGMLREREHDPDGARRDFSRVAKSHPRCPGIYSLRASSAWRMGDRAAAVEDAHRAITLHPENLDGFVRILYLAFGMRGPMEKGLENQILLQGLDTLSAQEASASWACAIRAAILGASDLQIAPLRRALEGEPGRAWVRAFLGRALSGQRPEASPLEDPREGLAQMDRAAALEPESGWIRAWRAEVLKRLGRKKEALEDLDLAVSLDPEYRLAFAWRSMLREESGDLAGAAADMSKCLEALPRPSFYRRRAFLEWEGSDSGRPLEDIALCVELSFSDALLHSALDWLVRDPAAEAFSAERSRMRARPPGPRDWKRLKKAVPALRSIPGGGLVVLSEAKLRSVADREPRRRALALAWLGRSRLMAGRAREALAVLDQSLELSPDSFLARAWASDACRGTGDFERALVEADRALALRPSYIPVRLGRAAALWALGNFSGCAQEVLSACRRHPESAAIFCLWTRWTLPVLWRPRSGLEAEGRLALVEAAFRAGFSRKALALARGLSAAALGPRGRRLLDALRAAADRARPAGRAL